MKLTIRTFAALLLFVLGPVELAHAQRTVSVYAGVGGVWDSSANKEIDTFGNGTLYRTPALQGVFVDMGSDVMLWSKFGVGGETSFLGSKRAFAGLEYRPIFYDFNALYQPLGGSRQIVPEFQGGMGGIFMAFCDGQQYCDAFTSTRQHFQIHFGGGVSVYVKNGFFVRPRSTSTGSIISLNSAVAGHRKPELLSATPSAGNNGALASAAICPGERLIES